MTAAPLARPVEVNVNLNEEGYPPPNPEFNWVDPITQMTQDNPDVTWMAPPNLASPGDRGDLIPPKAPPLPGASPLGNDLACPVGPSLAPNLVTPAWSAATIGAQATGNSLTTPATHANKSAIGGLSQIDQWAWEMGSEAGSMPSAWSKASSMNSSRRSNTSRMSSSTGDGLIPGLIDGQRLSGVKPSTVPTTGGKLVVTLRKEVPQGYWDHIEVVLVNGPRQVRLKPSSVKKGKKLCIEVPDNLTPGDYDVRLSFAQMLIQGAIPIEISSDINEEFVDETLNI